MSEIKRRAAEVREIAKSCECLHDLMVALSKKDGHKWPMATVIHWNEQLALGVPELRPGRKGGRREAQSSPKPEKKPAPKAGKKDD